MTMNLTETLSEAEFSKLTKGAMIEYLDTTFGKGIQDAFTTKVTKQTIINRFRMIREFCYALECLSKEGMSFEPSAPIDPRVRKEIADRAGQHLVNWNVTSLRGVNTSRIASILIYNHIHRDEKAPVADSPEVEVNDGNLAVSATLINSDKDLIHKGLCTPDKTETKMIDGARLEDLSRTFEFLGDLAKRNKANITITFMGD